MANWTEPLPKHPGLDYYECYAKVVLEELFPTEFVDLEIKDKPDLQTNDGEYGIEVTRAIDSDSIRADELYTDISYNRARNKKGAIEEIKKCGCKLQDGVLTGKPGTDSFDLILESFENKLNKLQKGYKEYRKNCLFIFSYIYANDRMINEAIQIMKQKQIDSEKKFYKVFILVPGYCYCLDLATFCYEIYRIESKDQYNQADKAREIVEKHIKK